jgi:phosphoglycolate phosphatase
LRVLVLGLIATSGYRHFIFDLDGTVVDSAADLVRATNQTLVRVGRRELPPEVVLGFVGQGVRRLLARSLRASAPPSKEALERASRIFADVYGAGLLDNTRPYPGMGETLRALASRGVVLSLLTNKPRAFTMAILAGLGLDGLFRGAICGDDDLPRKPAPAGAAELVRVSLVPAWATVVVGDSVEDLETARAAGLASCAVTWGFRSADDLARARPDHEVSRVEELLSLAPADSPDG